MHDNLPKSTEWTLISNIDFIICNYKTKKFIMVELKTHWKRMEQRQRWLYNMLHKRLMKGNDLDDRTFVGTYLISFMGEDFTDQVWIKWTDIKRKQIDEETLRSTLYYLIN